jgi:hypothetical protein
MRRIEYHNLACIGLLTLLACSAHAQSIETLQKGTIISGGFVTLGKRQVPIPPGEWKLDNVTEGRTRLQPPQSTDDARTVNALLIRNRNGEYDVRIRVFGSLASSRGQGWTAEPCKSDDVLYKNTFNSTFSHPECLLIDFRMPDPDNNINDTRLSATYSKYMWGDFLVVTYYVNPKLRGLTTSPASSRRNSEWHKDKIHLSKEKSEYLARFKEWALDAAGIYRQVLLGDATPVVGKIAPLP